MLAESRMMIPDCRKRLEASLADLKGTLVLYHYFSSASEYHCFIAYILSMTHLLYTRIHANFFKLSLSP